MLNKRKMKVIESDMSLIRDYYISFGVFPLNVDNIGRFLVNQNVQ